MLCQCDYYIIVLVDNFNDPLMHLTEDLDGILEALECLLVLPLAEMINCGQLVGGVLAGAPSYEEPECARGRADYLWSRIACSEYDFGYKGGAFGFSLDETAALAGQFLSESEVQSFVRSVQDTVPSIAHEGYNMAKVLNMLRSAIGQDHKDPHW